MIPIKGPKMIDKTNGPSQSVTKCKQPLIPSWKEYQTKLPTEEEITSLVHRVSGSQYRNRYRENILELFVFDLDSEEAVEYFESKGGFP